MHYKDGTEAKVGDLVKGTAYNTKNPDKSPKTIVGTMLQITPGSETCNCIVAFTEVVEATSLDTLQAVMADSPKFYPYLNEGRRVFLISRTDYSECKAFELVARPDAPAAPAPAAPAAG